jgi:hypothetical protein
VMYVHLMPFQATCRVEPIAAQMDQVAVEGAYSRKPLGLRPVERAGVGPFPPFEEFTAWSVR